MNENINIDGFIVQIKVEPTQEKGMRVFIPSDFHGKPKFNDACVVNTKENGVFRTAGTYHEVVSHNGHPDLLPIIPNIY